MSNPNETALETMVASCKASRQAQRLDLALQACRAVVAYNEAWGDEIEKNDGITELNYGGEQRLSKIYDDMVEKAGRAIKVHNRE